MEPGSKVHGEGHLKGESYIKLWRNQAPKQSNIEKEGMEEELTTLTRKGII